MNYGDFKDVITATPCEFWWVRYAEFCQLNEMKKTEEVEINGKVLNDKVPVSCPYMNDQTNCPYYSPNRRFEDVDIKDLKRGYDIYE